jgi:hypothetical protein
MKKLFAAFSAFAFLYLSSCTQCTECEYYYVLPTSLDTISGSEDYCGSNKVVSDFEEYYKQEIQNKAGLAGTAAEISCVRSKKQ